MSINRNIINQYLSGNYDDLRSVLDKKVNDNGDTIIHIIAMKLDKDTLQKIGEKYIKPHINIQNNQGECPIHKALTAIEESNEDFYDFITYLIDACGADPNIPDKNGRVISKLDTEMKSDTESLNLSTETKLEKDDTDIIKGVIAHYKQIGGIKKKDDLSELSDSGPNDSFILRTNDSDIYELSNDRVRPEPVINKEYDEILQKIIKILDVDEKTARIYRIILKRKALEEFPELRKREHFIEQIEKINKLLGKTNKSAEKILKTISKEAIDELQTEFSERSEKRMSEKKAKKSRKPKKVSDNTESSQKSTSTMKPKKVIVNSESSQKKVEKKKPKKNMNISENGYLHSDEILFSPDY